MMSKLYRVGWKREGFFSTATAVALTEQVMKIWCQKIRKQLKHEIQQWGGREADLKVADSRARFRPVEVAVTEKIVGPPRTRLGRDLEAGVWPTLAVVHRPSAESSGLCRQLDGGRAVDSRSLGY